MVKKMSDEMMIILKWQDNKRIYTQHFDFRLDGNINGQENGKQNDFAYAYFRDELKGHKIIVIQILTLNRNWGNGDGVGKPKQSSLDTKLNKRKRKVSWIKWWK